jgi:hypothetical protein
MPVANPANVNCVRILSNLDDMHTDLQTSIRATLGNNDELLDVQIVRQKNTNQVVIVYTYEDLSP